MFQGEYSVSLDAKGRLAIPTDFREPIARECGDELMLTYNGFDNSCLWLYPRGVWEEVRDEVMGLTNFYPQHRQMQRRLVGAARSVSPDGSGRIQLPVHHRQVAALEKKVIFMGMGSKFEIWNEEALNRDRFETPQGEPTEEMIRLKI